MNLCEKREFHHTRSKHLGEKTLRNDRVYSPHI